MGKEIYRILATALIVLGSVFGPYITGSLLLVFFPQIADVNGGRIFLIWLAGVLILLVLLLIYAVIRVIYEYVSNEIIE